MKKNLLIIALFIGVLVCAVGYSDSQYRTAIGHKAPALWIPGDNNTGINLNNLRGEYVLLNFWKSSDARSRLRSNDYTAWLRRHPESKIRYISVNLDETPGLFDEIVKLDSLIPSTQYHVEGKVASAITDSYGLKDGLGTMLIAPDGKIIAHNPSWEYLNQING